MKFTFNKEANLKKGQPLYGIIAVSTVTCDGVQPIEVYSIDWNNEEVIFKVEQPCRYVSCEFDEIERYVFETEEEALEGKGNLDFGDGMFVYEFE